MLRLRLGIVFALSALLASAGFALDVDFMAFSSHKMFGPNGVGVLYVRRDRFADLGLGNLGGGMVARHAEELGDVLLLLAVAAYVHAERGGHRVGWTVVAALLADLEL